MSQSWGGDGGGGVPAGECFWEDEHAATASLAMLNHPLSVTSNNRRLSTVTPASPSAFSLDGEGSVGVVGTGARLTVAL